MIMWHVYMYEIQYQLDELHWFGVINIVGIMFKNR
jgi:hypothetical protein